MKHTHFIYGISNLLVAGVLAWERAKEEEDKEKREKGRETGMDRDMLIPSEKDSDKKETERERKYRKMRMNQGVKFVVTY
jgi:hypothetical protein